MANVSVTYADMDAAGRRLVSDEESLNSQLNALGAYIEGLVTNGFVTETASVTFNDAYVQFKESQRKALQALTQMSNYLTTAATRMRETDQGLAVHFG